MAQLIGIVIIIVIGKIVFDYVKDQVGLKNIAKKKKTGDVIDLSDAWIDTSSLPYQLKESPINKRELAVYDLVEEVLLATQYTVSVKTQMADVLTLPRQTNNYQEYLNRIKERTFDLVILERPALKPVLVINMTSQNDQKKKQISDQFRENALTAAGLGSITIDSNADWNEAMLLKKLRSAGLKL